MGRLTTHVLDTAHGAPGAGVTVRLYRNLGERYLLVKEVVTNADGRADAPLLEGAAFSAGRYRLVFSRRLLQGARRRAARSPVRRRGGGGRGLRRRGGALPCAAAGVAVELFHLSRQLTRRPSRRRPPPPKRSRGRGLDGNLHRRLAEPAARWLHVIAGIAWIGTSFYFVWLDNNLARGTRDAAGVSGELWAIHGGGFYHLQKYLVAPAQLPENLHWFKWEAYIDLALGHGPARAWSTGAARRLPDRPRRCWTCRCAAVAISPVAGRRLARLRRAVPVAAGRATGCSVRCRLRADRAGGRGLRAGLRRPRRVHPRRRDDRHDHGGERLLLIIPGQRKMVAAIRAGAGAGPDVRAASASSAACTTPTSPCRCCSS